MDYLTPTGEVVRSQARAGNAKPAFMATKPYFASNADLPALRQERDELMRALDPENGGVLDSADWVRMSDRLKAVKQLIVEAEAQERHQQAEQRGPLVVDVGDCGRMRKRSANRVLEVPAEHVRQLCTAEKAAISASRKQGRAPGFMPVG